MSGDVITTINGPNVVGSHFKITATDKNYQVYAPGTVASTTWTIQGAYASPQTGGTAPGGVVPIDPTAIPTEDGGYQYTPLYKITVPGDTIDGYWNGSSGTHVVSTTIDFNPASGRAEEFKTASMDVVAPTGNIYQISTNSLGIQYRTDGNIKITTAGFAGRGSGIELGYTVDPNSNGAAGGKFGIVQTVDWRTYRTYTLHDDQGNITASLTRLTPAEKNDAGEAEFFSSVLDNRPANQTADGLFTPYYGSWDKPSILTWNVGGPDGTLKDTPSAQLQTAFGNANGQRIVDANVFTDTLMFTPPGGIPVPLGFLKWSYVADVNRGFDGKYSIDWTTSKNPYVSDVYKSSSVVPAWDIDRDRAQNKSEMTADRIPDNATDLTFWVPPPPFTPTAGDDWTNDGGADWNEWSNDGGTSWTDPAPIPFVQYTGFTSYDYPQLVSAPTTDAVATMTMTTVVPPPAPAPATNPYTTPPTNLDLIPDWSESVTTTQNIYYRQTPPAGKTKLVSLTDLPAGTQWWNMDSTSVYDPVQDTDLFYVWQ